MMQQMQMVHMYVCSMSRASAHQIAFSHSAHIKHNECMGCCGLDVVEAHAMVYIELKWFD